MSVFIDTNVLVRSIVPSSPMHEPAVRAIASVIESGEPVVLTPQVTAEFRNVVTPRWRKMDLAYPRKKPAMK
jgi:predicted nucleic acid-binding protein